MQKSHISFFAFIIALSGFAVPHQVVAQNTRSNQAYPSAAAPRQDANQETRRLVQDLTSQQAVSLIYASNLANARENQLITQNNQKDRQIRTLIAENRRALRAATNNEAEKRRLEQNLSQSQSQLDEVITERDNLTREIINRDNEAKQQIESYESAIRKVALSDDPRIIAYLERFAAGDNAAVDEFVSYARAQHEIRRHLNDIQFAEQLRVAGAQKNSQRHIGQATINDVIPLYREAYDLDKTDFDGGLVLANLYNDKGENVLSANIFLELLNIAANPTQRNFVLHGLGFAYKYSDPSKSLDYFRQSLEISRQNVAEQPQDIVQKRRLGASLIQYANLVKNVNHNEAEDKYREAMLLFQELFTADRTDYVAARGLMVAGENLALLTQIENPRRALGLFAVSLEMARELLKISPESVEAKSDVVTGLGYYGDFLRLSRPDTAKSLFEEAVSINLSILEADPNNQSALDVMISLYERLSVLVKDNDTSLSLEFQRKALHYSRAYSSADPNNIRAKEMLGMQISKLADKLETPSPQEALSLYNEAKDILTPLSNGNTNIGVMADLMYSHLGIGNLILQNDKVGAIENYKIATNYARLILAIEANDKHKMYLSVALLKSGDAILSNSPNEALFFYLEANGLDKSIVDKSLDDPIANRNFLITLRRIARIQNTLEAWNEAKTQADNMKARNIFNASDNFMYDDITNGIARIVSH